MDGLNHTIYPFLLKSTIRKDCCDFRSSHLRSAFRQRKLSHISTITYKPHHYYENKREASARRQHTFPISQNCSCAHLLSIQVKKGNSYNFFDNPLWRQALIYIQISAGKSGDILMGQGLLQVDGAKTLPKPRHAQTVYGTRLEEALKGREFTCLLNSLLFFINRLGFFFTLSKL